MILYIYKALVSEQRITETIKSGQTVTVPSRVTNNNNDQVCMVQ